MHRLDFGRFIDPLLLQRLPCFGVAREGKVFYQDCDSEMGRLPDQPYPDGTPVKVWIRDGWVVCQSLAEIEAENERIRIRLAEENRIREEKMRVKVAANKDFNASLGIPVKWFPEIKYRLGGLMENSHGNGMCSNSVFHVYLLEDLRENRLKRKAKSYLCSQPKGAHFAELINLQSDRVTEGQNYKVNCVKCLTLAQRFSRKDPK